MAEASSDPELEQKILQVLRAAGSPVKMAQLVKECQVPKRKLNQLLYRMKKESQVDLAGPATWQLGRPRTGEPVSTEPAPVLSADRPQQLTVAVPLKPGCQLSKQQEEIYRFLEANGPSKALIIAQSLGLKTAKDVNPDLYALRNKHLLNYDQNSKAWAVYQPDTLIMAEGAHEGGNVAPRLESAKAPGWCPPGPRGVDAPARGDPQGGLSILRMITCDGSWILNTGDKFKFLKLPCDANEVYLVARSSPRMATLQLLIDGHSFYFTEDSRERCQAANIIYQQNPINMICQNGPNSHISIESSEAVQIGHGNSIVRQEPYGDNGSTAPLCLSPPAPVDPSTQDPLAGSWGSQDIRLEKSVLRRVQLGHGNEMSLPGAPATRPDRSPSVGSPSVSPPVSATTADPEASFEIRMPTPGPQTEGYGDMTQRVLMKSCFLEDATIGNSNRMHVGPGQAGPRGGAGLEHSSRDSGEPAGEPAEDKAPRSEAAEPRGKVPHEGRQVGPDLATVTARLEDTILESRDPEATEDGPLVD